MTRSTPALPQTAWLELAYRGSQLRFELTQPLHRLGRDPSRCDLVIPDQWQVVARCQLVLKRQGEGYQIFDGDGTSPSTNGLFVGYTRVTPAQGYLLPEHSRLRIGQNPADQVQITYRSSAAPERKIDESSQAIALPQGVKLLLGRDPNADLVLDSPIVSRSHATIEWVQGQGPVLRDLSVNGVFAQGKKVEGAVPLHDGMILNVGPFVLGVQALGGQGLVLQMLHSGHQIRLDAHQLTRVVRDRQGQPKCLLDDITLAIEPGQLVALVGGSGAGKSTLMRTLLGVDPTTSGRVLINGQDLRSNFNIYRNQIGYVPQDDIIHSDLTVEEVLNYAARLRLPPDTRWQEVIDKTLRQIEMLERRHLPVSKLSGGQRKRVSIGVELLADPKLFFLDEPTSGLDPGLDKKMMQLLRKLADQGRTIVLVTHATSNIQLCDRLVFLGRNGQLCYFGPPQEALPFFQIQGDFADIYNTLETDAATVLHWKDRYRKSSHYQQYIHHHLSRNDSQITLGPPPPQPKTSGLQQGKLLTLRYGQLMLRDQINLGLILAPAPIAMLLMTLVTQSQQPFVLGKDPDPTLAGFALKILFVLTCSGLWVGLSGSLQEVVKEQAIYQRERLVNLGIPAYVGSKLAILAGVAGVQTLLMMIVVTLCFESPEAKLLSWTWGLGITNFLTLLTSVSLGLLVSSLVKNISQANSLLPLLLLPQIIFSGVLFKNDGISDWIAKLMLSRWSIGAYGTLVNVNHLIPAQPQGAPNNAPKLPFEPSQVYDPTWSNLWLNWGMLLLFSALYLGIAAWNQRRKDIL
jgi:ABC transport system ATP-binding/permease protein